MVARRRPDPKPLRRKVETRSPRKTLVVFCEGERTEPEYLDALQRDPAVHDVASVDIRIGNPGRGAVPLTLVELAIAAKKRAEREQGEVDEFWCVFDVEWPRHHPHLREAVDLAQRHGIQLAISNPCFELWLLLHLANRTAFLDTAEACRLRRARDGQADKGLDPVRYMAARAVAADRARALERRHARNGSRMPDDNPSSGMYRLIESVTG